jgi:hypothetical protein
MKPTQIPKSPRTAQRRGIGNLRCNDERLQVGLRASGSGPGGEREGRRCVGDCQRFDDSVSFIKRLVNSFHGLEEDPGILRAAGGDAKGLSRMHARVALAVFLQLLVAPALAMIVHRWLGLGCTLRFRCTAILRCEQPAFPAYRGISAAAKGSCPIPQA